MTLKTIIAAAAAIATTATVASANSFDVDTRIDSAHVLELGLIVADNAGTLEIYDYRTGSQGKLLASESVFAGANTNVRIPVGSAPSGDIIAVLTVDGQPVASQKFDVEFN